MFFLQNCSDLTARTHFYSCKKVRRPQLLYKVDLGVWHSGCVDRPETIPNFQAKVFPLNCWGRIDRQFWAPTGRSLPGTEMLICISKRLLLATHLLCPNLGKEMMELHTGCQNLSFATVVTPVLMPSFLKRLQNQGSLILKDCGWYFDI